jgi:VanZ family protein
MMILIFIASGTPGNDLPDFGSFDFDIKKAGHMAGYAILAATFARALSFSSPISKRIVALSVFMACLYAITDEFHQLYTPGRSSSPIDVGIDTAGAILGALIWSRVSRNSRVEIQD